MTKGGNKASRASVTYGANSLHYFLQKYTYFNKFSYKHESFIYTKNKRIIKEGKILTFQNKAKQSKAK